MTVFQAGMDFDAWRKNKALLPGGVPQVVRRGPCGDAVDRARRKIPLRGTGPLGLSYKHTPTITTPWEEE